MNPFIQHKSVTDAGIVKDVDTTSRTVSGYLSNFGNVDSDGDIIAKGAFAKSIAERKDAIFFLYQHNWEKPLSKFKTLQEDDRGLYFEAELSKTSYGNDLLQLYADGVINEHSIGFNTVKSDTDVKSGVRNIREVKLWEGSAVTLGANSATPFTGFKSAKVAIKELQEKQGRLIKAIKSGNYTDETFAILEIGLKELQAQAYELGKSTHDAAEPQPEGSTPTPASVEPQVIQSIFTNFNL